MLKESMVFMMVVTLCLAGATHDTVGQRGAVADSPINPRKPSSASNDGDEDLQVAASAYNEKGHYESNQGHDKGHYDNNQGHNKGHYDNNNNKGYNQGHYNNNNKGHNKGHH